MRSIFLTALLGTMTLDAEAQGRDSTNPEVAVIVDPRIELMSVVQLLNDYLLVTRYNSRYKKDARKHFSAYADHEAVQLFREMSQARFNFDAVPKVMLSLSDPPELNPVREFLPEVVERAGSADSLAHFVKALRDFAQETAFDTFFEAHAGTFQTLLDSARLDVQAAVDVLADYSGIRPPNSTVILGPLLHHGGFAATFGDGDVMEVYALVGPEGVTDGLPEFGSAERMGSLVWHEFSHTFVNALTALYPREVEATSALFEPIAAQMKPQAYLRWEVALNEHVVRAITTRLTYREYGEEAGSKAMQGELNRGFKYIEPLIEGLKVYEENRARYATLADFYPQLIEVVESVADRK